MPKFSANTVVQQQHIRFFYQKGGSSPKNRMYYGGVSGQYINIESVENPRKGSISPINVGNPRKRGSFSRVGSETSPAEFPTGTVEFMQNKGVLPRSLYDIHDCKVTYFQTVGQCSDPGDFIGGWDDYVKILSNGQATNATEGGSSFDSDSGVMDSIPTTFEEVYVIGSLGFGEGAASEVYAEVVDIVYGSKANCSSCGPDSDGTDQIYAVTKNTAASAGQAPSITYFVNGVWATQEITGSTSTDVPTGIEIVGNKLLVLFDDGATGGYFMTTINRITGIPASNWTKVTTGFVSGKAPQDIYIDSLADILIVGKGGYVYHSSSINSGVTVLNAGEATTEDLNRIDAFGEIIVAGGANGALIYSINQGVTFAVADNLPGSAAITGVSVVGDFAWWAIATDGAVYFTDTQGEIAWEQRTLPSASAVLNGGHDIVFVNDEVGYIAASSASTGYLFSTWNGGRDWAVSSDDATPRIKGFPTLTRVNRVAYPKVKNQSVASNNIAIAGLSGGGTDGIITTGVAAVK